MTLIREERDRIMNQWTPPKQAHEIRTRPPPPGRPPQALKAVNLMQPGQTTEDEEDDQEDSHLYQVQALMKVSNLSPYWKAAHATASVSLQDSSRVVSAGVITLFDTDASCSLTVPKRSR